MSLQTASSQHVLTSSFLTSSFLTHLADVCPSPHPLQVMALLQAPFLMSSPHVGLLFAPDAILRAKKYLAMTTGGVGKRARVARVYMHACIHAYMTQMHGHILRRA